MTRNLNDIDIKLVNNFKERKIIARIKPSNLILNERYDMLVERHDASTPLKYHDLDKNKISDTLRIMRYCPNLEVYVSFGSRRGLT